MKELIIEDKKYFIPEDWDDISLYTYENYLNIINNELLSEHTKYISIINLLTGVEKELILEYQELLEILINELSFMINKIDIKYENFININEYVISLDKSVFDLEFGQFIDLESNLKSNKYIDLLKSILIFYQDEYNTKLINEVLIEIYNNIKISQFFYLIEKIKEELNILYQHFHTLFSKEEDSKDIGSQLNQKFGWLNIIYQLIDYDITKIDQLTKIKVSQVFTFLIYLTDKNKIETLQHMKEQVKQKHKV